LNKIKRVLNSVGDVGGGKVELRAVDVLTSSVEELVLLIQGGGVRLIDGNGERRLAKKV
jgi:hypothetical protein